MMSRARLRRKDRRSLPRRFVVDVAKLHERAVEEFVARVEAVGDRWSAPTPCPKWDVRALVNHVVAEDLWTPTLMAGGTLDETGDRFDGDVLGQSPVATARAAGDAAVVATAEALATARTVHLSDGDSTAEEYAYQLAADHVIHGWDLAVATGGDADIDPDLVETLAVWFAEREERYRAAGHIGDRPADGDSSGAQDQLLAAFGAAPPGAASGRQAVRCRSELLGVHLLGAIALWPEGPARRSDARFPVGSSQPESRRCCGPHPRKPSESSYAHLRFALE